MNGDAHTPKFVDKWHGLHVLDSSYGLGTHWTETIGNWRSLNVDRRPVTLFAGLTFSSLVSFFFFTILFPVPLSGSRTSTSGYCSLVVTSNSSSHSFLEITFRFSTTTFFFFSLFYTRYHTMSARPEATSGGGREAKTGFGEALYIELDRGIPTSSSSLSFEAPTKIQRMETAHELPIVLSIVATCDAHWPTFSPHQHHLCTNY